MLTWSAGIATGCVAGQRPRIEYAMWLWWSAESRLTPSQQSGNWTWSASPFIAESGHVGIVACGRTSATGPQFQDVIFSPCADVAFEFPAIILNPGGNVWSAASVCRR